LRDVIRDAAALAGLVCLVAAGLTVALPVGLVVAGVGLIAAAVLSGTPPKPPEGSNDGSD
jgi:hypothetical protein